MIHQTLSDASRLAYTTIHIGFNYAWQSIKLLTVLAAPARRVDFKVTVMAFRVLHGLAPPYLNQLVRVAEPLPSARQHPSYGDCLEVKREYY